MKTINLILLVFFTSALFSGALLKAIQIGWLTQTNAFVVGAIGGASALAAWFTWASLQPAALLYLFAFIAGAVLGVV